QPHLPARVGLLGRRGLLLLPRAAGADRPAGLPLHRRCERHGARDGRPRAGLVHAVNPAVRPRAGKPPAARAPLPPSGDPPLSSPRKLPRSGGTPSPGRSALPRPGRATACARRRCWGRNVRPTAAVIARTVKTTAAITTCRGSIIAPPPLARDAAGGRAAGAGA